MEAGFVSLAPTRQSFDASLNGDEGDGADTADTADAATHAVTGADAADRTLFKAGTAQYMAPEIVQRGQYSHAVDWWACGVTFFHCATGRPLFNGANYQHLFELICHGDIDLAPLRALSEPLESLVGKLLTRDVASRLGSRSSAAVRLHPFFTQRHVAKAGAPPFKPTAAPIDPSAPKNYKLFYGSRFLPRAAHAPSASSPNGARSASGGGGVRLPLTGLHNPSISKTKRSTKLKMQREFVRFASISDLRGQWMQRGMLDHQQQGQKGGGQFDNWGDDSSTQSGNRDGVISSMHGSSGRDSP